jgi:hypothetical protein
MCLAWSSPYLRFLSCRSWLHMHRSRARLCLICVGAILRVAFLAGQIAIAQSHGGSPAPSSQSISASPRHQSSTSGIHHPGSHLKSLQLGVQPDDTLTYIVELNKKTLLKDLLVADEDCDEITPGSWKVDSQPAHGKVSTGLVSGTLLNGECPGIDFTAAAIYYTWTDADTDETQDTFQATWSGDGYTEPETFILNLKNSCDASGAGKIQPSAACPAYTIEVTSNGSNLASGACAHISADNPPVMPKLVAKLKSSNGQALTGKVQWNITADYVGPDDPSTDYSFVLSGSLTASQSWTIPFKTNFIGADPYYGGGATIKATYNGVAPKPFSFCIDGTNPDPDDIHDQIGPTPWYAYPIAEQESTLRQFVKKKNGEWDPVWGPPHGFGIMQVDPPRKQADLFSWTQNITDGIDVLDTKSDNADDFWDSQVDQYNAFIAANSGQAKKYPHPANKAVASCTFGWSSSSTVHPFEDALTIQAFNGNGSGAYYLSWHNPIKYPSKPGWAQNIPTSKGCPKGYVYCVCSKDPY